MSDQIPQPFICKVEEHQGTAIVRLSGDLDIVSAAKCGERLHAVLHENDGDTIIDLRGLTFLDSMGLSALLTAHNAGPRSGSSVSFIRGNRTVHRVFEITNTHTRLRWANPDDLGVAEDS